MLKVPHEMHPGGVAVADDAACLCIVASSPPQRASPFQPGRLPFLASAAVMPIGSTRAGSQPIFTGGPEDFSDPEPHGVHLVTVQCLGAV